MCRATVLTRYPRPCGPQSAVCRTNQEGGGPFIWRLAWAWDGAEAPGSSFAVRRSWPFSLFWDGVWKFGSRWCFRRKTKNGWSSAPMGNRLRANPRALRRRNCGRHQGGPSGWSGKKGQLAPSEKHHAGPIQIGHAGGGTKKRLDWTPTPPTTRWARRCNHKPRQHRDPPPPQVRKNRVFRIRDFAAAVAKFLGRSWPKRAFPCLEPLRGLVDQIGRAPPPPKGPQKGRGALPAPIGCSLKASPSGAHNL